MKDLEKIRKNIDGSWYYKCNCCAQWKIETEFGCDKYCKARHGTHQDANNVCTCLIIIRRGIKVFIHSHLKTINYIVQDVINIKILKNSVISKMLKTGTEK